MVFGRVVDLVALGERPGGPEGQERDVEPVALSEGAEQRQGFVGVRAVEGIVAVEHGGRRVGHGEHAVVAHLNAGDPRARGDRHLLEMGQLADARVSEPLQPAQHQIMIDARHQHRGPPVQALQRRIVEVVVMHMGDVDVVHRRKLRNVALHFRNVPPAPEERGPDDPRIHQNPRVLGLAQ